MVKYTTEGAAALLIALFFLYVVATDPSNTETIVYGSIGSITGVAFWIFVHECFDAE